MEINDVPERLEELQVRSARAEDKVVRVDSELWRA